MARQMESGETTEGTSPCPCSRQGFKEDAIGCASVVSDWWRLFELGNRLPLVFEINHRIPAHLFPLEIPVPPLAVQRPLLLAGHRSRRVPRYGALVVFRWPFDGPG